MSGRPLYGSFAWAYDRLVESSGPSLEFVASELRARGVGPGASVVDAGCGTGEHALGLWRRGYRVVGFDRSPDLVAAASSKARRTASSVRFEVGDLLRWRPASRCDGVLCRGVLNDITEEEDRERALHALADMLRSGGALVLDVREWEASLRRYEGGRLLERSVETPRGTLTFRSRTTPEPAGGLLRVHETLVLGDLQRAFDFTMRPWTREELEGGLAAAGFVVARLHEPGAAARSDRLVVTATRAALRG